MAGKIGNGSIPLRIGRLIDTTVYGGPYRDVPEFFWGVKMAVEIQHPHMVAVDTKDFNVPKVSDLKAGIVKALMAMINEEDVYAGCMGGIGRTGIFLAALAKVQIEYRKAKHRSGRGEDPVLYVRKHFIPHAVETAQQEKYIADLDVSDIVEWLSMTQSVMGLGGLTPARTVDCEETHLAAALGNRPCNTCGEDTWVKVKQPWIAEADKLDNPSFDHYEAEWKSNRNSRKIDWVDAPDADSSVTRTDDTSEAYESCMSRLDEIEQAFEEHTEAVNLTIKALTNETWSGKIRRLFK